ncbi:ABC transporter ATP-binding protein/permease [Erwinia sp. V71]|uniref:ABC transporter ATP-binding protein/permease n=1 Tax=Erwinia sp. V71 TaxID=3369424 RepID=UPI003F61F058
MKKFASQLWALCCPFWGTRRSWQAWLLVGVILALGGSVIYLNVLINQWSKSFYDALAALDGGLLYSLFAEYGIFILIYIVVFVYEEWFRRLLIIRWRSALTAELVDSWLAKRAFYRMSLSGGIDNPDQRISEDINKFVKGMVDLSIDFLMNFVQLFSFVFILWSLSGVQHITLFGSEWTIHGYLVWVALVYSLVGSVVMQLLSHKLHGINVQKERVEANFRASLLRKHDNAEQIAQYGGETQEKSHLLRGFSMIVSNWRRLMNAERDMRFFAVGFQRVSFLIPVLAALPMLLNKTVTLGGLMQIRSAFNQVHTALSWFIRVYPALVELSASMARLTQFRDAIREHQSQQDTPQAGGQLAIDELSFATPQGKPLLQNVVFRCEAGSWSKLSGQSGLGKSTLLRTLNGLWPYYDGKWQPLTGRSLLLPQQSYLGQGTLGEILCYPQSPLADSALLQCVLEKVGLATWGEHLGEQLNWDRIFSGGERQRLAFARALIARPDTLYLDEATSNLDHASARQLLELIRHELPETTVVAITHQKELDDLFPQQYDLTAFSHA